MKITRQRLEEILEEEISDVQTLHEWPEYQASREEEGIPDIIENHDDNMAAHAPDIDDDKRARELLDGFRSMLKPNEKAAPEACATFLRQLADLVDHENEASGGNMQEPAVHDLEE